MKKILAFALCFVLLLCGCDKKAEPYYDTSAEGVTFTTFYHYYFTDDTFVQVRWMNDTDKTFHFTDEFRLEKLSGNTWYLVSEKEEPSFNEEYYHYVDPHSKSASIYHLDLYTDLLTEGTTYRISTSCRDDEENYYQLYAEFICDNEAAEAELADIIESGAESSQAS